MLIAWNGGMKAAAVAFLSSHAHRYIYICFKHYEALKCNHYSSGDIKSDNLMACFDCFPAKPMKKKTSVNRLRNRIQESNEIWILEWKMNIVVVKSFTKETLMISGVGSRVGRSVHLCRVRRLSTGRFTQVCKETATPAAFWSLVTSTETQSPPLLSLGPARRCRVVPGLWNTAGNPLLLHC